MNATVRERSTPLTTPGVMPWLVGAALMLVLGTAGLLAARRLADALIHPLPALGLIAVGAVVAVLILVLRRMIAARGLPRIGRVASEVALSVAVLGIALSLWVPGTSPWGVGLFAGVLLLEEAAGWTLVARRSSAARSAAGRGRSSVETKAPTDDPNTVAVHSPEGSPEAASLAQHAPMPAEQQAGIPAPAAAEPDDGTIAQQFTRRRTATGADELTGWLRVAFVAGQRTERAHLAFCPAFVRPPRVEVEQIDGPEARIKKAQILPYGARLDLKLSGRANQPREVILHIVAVDEPPEATMPSPGSRGLG